MNLNFLERIKVNGNSPNALLVASGVCFAGSIFSLGSAVGYALCRRKLVAEFDARLTSEVVAVKSIYAKKLVDVRVDVDHYNKKIDEALEAIKHFHPVAGEIQPSDVHAESVYEDAFRDMADSGADHEDDGSSAMGDDSGDDDYVDPEDRPVGYVHIAEHEQGSMVTQNVFRDSGVEDVTPEINHDKPYGIGLEEFCDPPEGYQQLTITYFASDKVLLDDKTSPIRDIVKMVGPLSALDFGGISRDPHIRYVRNEKLQTDFEIILNAGSYADEILNYGRPNPSQDE